MASRFRYSTTPNSSLADLSVALLGALFLALLSFYCFTTKPEAKEDTGPDERETASVFVAPKLPGVKLADWEKRLHEWAEVYDPTRFLLPDEQMGFSRILRERKSLFTVSKEPKYDFSVTPAAETPQPLLHLALGDVSLQQQFHDRWKNFTTPPPAAPPPDALPAGVFWHDPSGKILTDMPSFPEEKVRSLVGEDKKPHRETSIEVLAGMANQNSRICVRQSSGNIALDQLATDAIRRTVGQYELRRKYYPNAPRPAILPPPGKSRFLKIEWRLLPPLVEPAEKQP